MPSVSRLKRQSDFHLFSSHTPIVIDNGASYFRIGWAGEFDPRVVFRHIVQSPRHKATGEIVTIVGHHDPAVLKYFDCTRSSPRSAFDSNVVCQFETMEYILDFGFDRMGANGSEVELNDLALVLGTHYPAPEIDHPVLITECVCNPVQSRSKMAELLFETYGVPSIAFGVDVAFSYKYNQEQGICAQDGLALCPGFSTTHAIPFVDGEPVYKGCCRTNIGGSHLTDYLKELLSLKYPDHSDRFTWEKVEDLKMEHCYIAPNYDYEVRLFKKRAKEAEEKTRSCQLPWVPPPTGELPSEKVIARKAAIEEKHRQRLREMTEAKRSSKINELENELHGLEFLLHQFEQVEQSDVPSFLAATRYVSWQEIEIAYNKVTQSLHKAKGEPKNEQAETEKADLAVNEEENSELSLKLEQLHARYEDLSEKISQHKRLHGERPNAAQSQRDQMRHLMTEAFHCGKSEDTFGAKDDNRKPYKLMSKDNIDDDEGADEDEAKVVRISSRLQDLDPTFVPKLEEDTSLPAEVPKFYPLTKEDIQIVLGRERFECPELLFNPNWIGVDQAGLAEIAGVSMKRLPYKDESLEERLTNSILVTGGSSLFPGIIERLEAGIRMIRPSGSPIKIVRALDPVLDAWRGAASFASTSKFHTQTFTKKDFYEKGEDWLRNYQLQYTL